MDLFEGISLHTPTAPLIRNINGLRVSENLYDDLTGSPEAWAAAQRLDIQTKPHAYADQDRIIHRPFDEAAWFDVVQFPFENWQETRFSDGKFGVWYGAADLETTIHETAYHWNKNLIADVGLGAMDGLTIERAVYSVDCHAALLNYAYAEHLHASLRSPSSYAITQDLGRKMIRDGHPGLISLSARCDGKTYAIFNPGIIENPRNHSYLTYRIEGGETVVEREVGKTLLTIPPP